MECKSKPTLHRYAGHERYQVATEELPAPPPKVERACMCCRKPFMSEGIHNRICKGCKERAATGAYEP
jgi:hypothetical protein